VARHRLLAPSALVALALCLSACTADEPAAEAQPSASPSSDGPRVIQPGRPGEENEVVGPGNVDLVADPANGQDAMFMQMMVPHHAQAIEMSALAPKRAEDERVLALARRIGGAQGPEILTMEGWLQERGLEVPEAMWGDDGHTDHDHEMMAGMLTAAQMKELRKARGSRFDRLYLRGMIRHHQGAVDMSGEQMADGSEQLALEMASEISAGQAAEIGRMRELLGEL
jgi:uncharacterized protein (DUF305 family)